VLIVTPLTFVRLVMICTSLSIPLVSAATSNSVLNAAQPTPVQVVFLTTIL